MTRLVLATGNPDKVKEIRPLLAGTAVDLVGASQLIPSWDVEEVGTTLSENALLKAQTASDLTGLPAIADDTGLFVDVLNGEPGVHSSRYAGAEASYDDNVRKLLRELETAPQDRRSAKFRTVAVLLRPDGILKEFEGVLEGRILEEPSGTGGFGYDPIFLPEGADRTLAELSIEEKNRLSHRAQAFVGVAEFLSENPDWLIEKTA